MVPLADFFPLLRLSFLTANLRWQMAISLYRYMEISTL